MGHPQVVSCPSLCGSLQIYLANSYSCFKTHRRGHFLRIPFLTSPNRSAVSSRPYPQLYPCGSSLAMLLTRICLFCKASISFRAGPCILSSNKPLLSTYYVPDTDLSPGAMVVNRTDKGPWSPRVSVLVGREIIYTVHKFRGWEV